MSQRPKKKPQTQSEATKGKINITLFFPLGVCNFKLTIQKHCLFVIVPLITILIISTTLFFIYFH